MPAFRPLEDRFWEKVQRGAADECWPWTGAVNLDRGYGRIRLSRTRRTDFAHRVAYELHYGPIPEGKIICHRCGNPKCVNPAHLYAGTFHDNNVDRIDHGRQAGGARPGEKHHMAKLTAAEVERIRERLANGEIGSALAREYGVSASQVSRIKRGENW